MDQKLVVKEALTEGMIEGELRLIKKLDSESWHPESAFWYFDDETNQWRLFLASVNVERKGPRDAYTRIARALDDEKITEFGLDSISAVPPRNVLVRTLKAIKVPGLQKNIRVQRNAFNGHFIADALLYRSE